MYTCFNSDKQVGLLWQPWGHCISRLETSCKTALSSSSEDKQHAVQGIARLEGEMQAVRALLGNSSTIVAALREIATPSTATRYPLTLPADHN